MTSDTSANSVNTDGLKEIYSEGYTANEVESSAALFEDHYDELLKIARRLRRKRSPSETLNTTSLVHEAFLRLNRKDGFENDAHFFASVALAVRHTLIDHARKGGDNASTPEAIGEEIDDVSELENEGPSLSHDDIIAVRQGLEFIAEHDPRLVRVVDCRYFIGLTLEETALVLDLNEKTVRRDWVKARALLRAHLASGRTTRMPD